MRTLQVALLILLVLLPVAARSDESVRITFDDLPRLIQERNQHVAGAQRLASASRELSGHFTRSWLPSLDAHVGGERFRTGHFATMSQPYGGVEARMNLFRGGRDRLEEAFREAQATGAGAAFDRVRGEELTKARRSYWELVYQNEISELLKEAIKHNETNLISAKNRISAGRATETDRIEFEMHRSQLAQDLARMDLGSANSERNLKVLIGQASDTRVEPESRIPHLHDDSLLTADFDPLSHWEVREAMATGEAANRQRAQAKRWWTPELDLYAGYALYTLRDRDSPNRAERTEPYAGVRLTFSVFDGFQSQARASALAFEAGGRDLQATQSARELAAQFVGARQQLRLTHDLIHDAENSVAQGAKYLERTQSEYARGVKNSPEVLGATEKYFELRRRYAELRRDFQIARVELLTMLGK